MRCGSLSIEDAIAPASFSTDPAVPPRAGSFRADTLNSMHPRHPKTSHGEERVPGVELRPRLLAAYLGVAVVILVASLVAAIILRNVDRDSERVIRDLAQRASIVARLRQEFLFLRIAEKNIIIEDTPDGMDRFEQRIRASEQQIESLVSELGRAESSSRTLRLAQFRAGFAEFRAVLQEAIALSREHSLARAAELSRGECRRFYGRARDALVSALERNRTLIAESAAQPAAAERVERLTALISRIRDALEGLHELQYLQQSSLLTFSLTDRAAAVGQVRAMLQEVRAAGATLESSDSDDDRRDAAFFGEALDGWSAVNEKVCGLAESDTKARAMTLSTTAVRDAYLRASQVIDDLMAESDGAMQAMQDEQVRALRTSRNLLVTMAVSGLALAGLTGWLTVHLLMRDYRAAAELLMRGG